jgi:hypothetical protein
LKVVQSNLLPLSRQFVFVFIVEIGFVGHLCGGVS